VQAGSEARLGGTFLRAVGRGVEGRTKGEGDGGWEGTGAEKPGRNIDNGIVLAQGYCKRMRMKRYWRERGWCWRKQIRRMVTF